MLEFHADYFKPEIRNGFYVDTTMKTVWAAELEIVQTIAEICDRHGLTWFIGFGTLLGAIRHEGFIPWDDDIDLMMLREDYRKLVEVLPQELPEGYRFRSAYSQEGYSEFHSNVVNGTGIDTSPAFLQQFHNCPFTVGVDIFPMDYLPRDAQKREKQRALFQKARKVAWMAQSILEGIRTDVGILENLKAGMQDLIQECMRAGIGRVRFENNWFRGGQWNEIMKQALQAANRIAGMYPEQDCDGIVMYNDYSASGCGIYPKEWFSEVYGATFEDFMLPIPNGYDDILRVIYGDYMVCRRAPSQHEYPFYAHQLRQLRAIVKQQRAQAIAQGLIQEEAEEKILPKDWKSQLGGKKVILYVSGLPMYSEYGDKALDKLEDNLRLFEENKDKIMLWWRPQTQMRTLLGLLSVELVERYDALLANYKERGWGICDESDDEERAVEYCDAYYGEVCEMQRMAQQRRKPVMIEQMV